MILGTRGSPLARRQSGWVVDRLLAAHPGLVLETILIRTAGDLQQNSPDAFFGAGDVTKGIFVKEIEDAMLERRIDIAVHSIKDLPIEQPRGLVVSAIPGREDPRDALVTREGLALAELPGGARVGTSSPRRVAQLAASRPDIVFLPVRGNVDTRIRKMMAGEFEGVVLAAAGLTRLGLLGDGQTGGARVSLLPENLCLPAVGQGALAIETRVDDTDTRSLVAVLDDALASVEVAAERAFLAALGGGCRVPVAALARAAAQRVTLRGLVASPDGTTIVRAQGESDIGHGADLGRQVARQVLQRGAAALLAPAEG